MTNAKLIKIDRNGSKHYEGPVECDRCGGDGIYKWGAMINGRPQYIGICYKCLGAGKVLGKWIERTPEYQAKLDERREAKRAAAQAKREAERAEREAEWARQREEERRELEERKRLEAERKAVSQHIGEVGDKVALDLTYTGSASWEQPAFSGYGTELHFIHKFEDAAGNVITWKTGSALGWADEKGYWFHPAEGTTVNVSGRIKEHTTYNDQKQTMLTRCKVKPA